ncbi:MAG: hypothetical protein LiPW39_37 [Parcubacteria group bacterium LiPW_39]|nr:MAG: hypothetical protein LiPW39_37 [Parcubacteria group bacterium LiPW_39]
MLTLIIFVIILGLLIFVHEFGHFLVAKKNGVRVEEFGFGFPPRIFGIKKGETIYSLNWIPLGGFVKIFGEDGSDRINHRSFASKKIWQRTIILLAGVAMNVFLAAVVISLGYGLGLPTAIDDSQVVSHAKVQITEVAPNSPARQGGIKAGDTIVKIVDQVQLNNISQVAQVQNFINNNRGREIIVTLQRGQEVRQVKVVPRINPPAGEGALGIGLVRVTTTFYPWYRAIYEGVKTTFILIWAIIMGLGYLLWQLVGRGQVPVAEIAGPVGIFSLTGQAAQLGFIYLLQLTALLSVNLAIINALPFPALDGGRLLFLLIEKIKGSPVNQKIERAIHSAGFVFLIILMVLITARDMMKLF